MTIRWKLAKLGKLVRIYLLGLAFALDPSAFANSHAAPPSPPMTRRILGGDLVYSSSAFHTVESRAAFEAEARALQLLASECGGVPKGTRVFLQNFERYPQGTVANVSLGLPVVDCEKLRVLSSDQERNGLTDIRLSRLVESYERGLTSPSLPQAPHFKSTAPVSQIQFLVPAELEQAWDQDLTRRANLRMSERRNLAGAH